MHICECRLVLCSVDIGSTCVLVCVFAWCVHEQQRALCARKPKQQRVCVLHRCAIGHMQRMCLFFAVYVCACVDTFYTPCVCMNWNLRKNQNEFNEHEYIARIGEENIRIVEKQPSRLLNEMRRMIVWVHCVCIWAQRRRRTAAERIYEI